MTKNNSPTAYMRLIEQDDIQLIRYWRNLDHVRNKLMTSNLVSRDGQRNWFGGLNIEKSQYFIFSLDQKDIGCASLNNIQFCDKTFEAGIFCGDINFLNHWINIWACCKLYDYAFNELQLETAHATILIDNTAAINLNKSLGYVRTGTINDKFGKFTLERSQYILKSEKIRRYLNDFAQQEM